MRVSNGNKVEERRSDGLLKLFLWRLNSSGVNVQVRIYSPPSPPPGVEGGWIKNFPSDFHQVRLSLVYFLTELHDPLSITLFYSAKWGKIRWEIDGHGQGWAGGCLWRCLGNEILLILISFKWKSAVNARVRCQSFLWFPSCRCFSKLCTNDDGGGFC